MEFLALDPAGMLSAAVCASDAGKTARLLESHPELKTQINEPMANYGGFGLQALFAAVQRSDCETIDVLFRAGADVNARSRWRCEMRAVVSTSPSMLPLNTMPA